MKKLLALLLLLMAVGQLIGWGRFVEVIGEYQFGSLHTLIFCLELFGGIGLWFGQPKSFMAWWGSRAAFAVSLIWAFLVFQAYARGLELENAGFFGGFFPQYVGTGVLFQSILLILWSFFVKKSVMKKKRGRK